MELLIQVFEADYLAGTKAMNGKKASEPDLWGESFSFETEANGPQLVQD